MKNQKYCIGKESRCIKILKCMLLGVFFFLVMMTSYVHASLDWQVTVRIESGSVYNRLVLGADETATNGYDSVWDTYALLNGQIEAYFPHPEWGNVHIEYQRDIRAHSPVDAIEWLLTIESSLPVGSILTVTWSFLNVPSDYQLVVINEDTNEQIDMQLNSSYQFTYSGISSYRITVNESSSCLNLPVRILETSEEFPTLQEAYNTVAPGHTVQSHAVSFTQDLNVNLNKAITIIGGYDCNFENIIGDTNLNGNISTNNGSVELQNFTLEQ